MIRQYAGGNGARGDLDKIQSVFGRYIQRLFGGHDAKLRTVDPYQAVSPCHEYLRLFDGLRC
jgi:hypothetical protein